MEKNEITIMEKNEKILSIIIPEFNGIQTITKCLNSIYGQGISNNEFEVICVDDGSTDGVSVPFIEAYEYDNKKPDNFNFIKNKKNRRQGAARNTGIDNASGDWIIYLDCDDYLIQGNLILLIDFLKQHNSLDMVIYNFSMLNREFCNNHFPRVKMDARLFLKTQPVPWSPCSIAYKRQLLRLNNIRFVEGLLFEDVDYVIKCVLCAKYIQYVAIPIFFYVQYEKQTSKIFSDFRKAEDAFKLADRLKKMALEVKEDKECCNAILKHHYYLYSNNLRLLTYFSMSQNIYLLKQYPTYLQNNNIPFFVRLSNRNPIFVSLLMIICKPILFVFRFVKNKIHQF